jgi:hypothetical protein
MQRLFNILTAGLFHLSVLGHLTLTLLLTLFYCISQTAVNDGRRFYFTKFPAKCILYKNCVVDMIVAEVRSINFASYVNNCLYVAILHTKV